MKVSIITVCLNNAETVEDTIVSVKQQDHDDIEHIIIDGGSTDQTLEIVNKHHASISRVISEKDNGIYDAMNKGLKFATGDIIGFLNSDDVYANDNVIGKIVDAIKNNNVDCCYGNLEYVALKNPEEKIRIWMSKSNQDD